MGAWQLAVPLSQPGLMTAGKQSWGISSSMLNWWERALRRLKHYAGWQLGFTTGAACLVVLILAFVDVLPTHVLIGWLLATIGFSFMQQLWLTHPDSPLHPNPSLSRSWVFQWTTLVGLQGAAWGLGAFLLHRADLMIFAAPDWADGFMVIGLLALTLPTGLWLSPLFPTALVYLLCALLLPALAFHFHAPGGRLPFLVMMSGVVMLGYSAVRSLYMVADTTREQDRSLEEARKREAEALQDKQEAVEKTMNVSALLYQDALTRIANRRHFDDFLGREWRRCARSGNELSLVMIDIDFFKPYNDHFGHPAGDRCLQRVAAILNSFAKRASDLTARYGGEEFAIIMAETDASAATNIAENIRHAVESERIDHPYSSVAPVVTVSMGVATLSPGRDQGERDLVEHADQALYQAKTAGRNRVVLYAEPGAEDIDLDQLFPQAAAPPGGIE